MAFSLFTTGYVAAIQYFAWNTFCWWVMFGSWTFELICQRCYVSTYIISNTCGQAYLAYACNTNPYSNPFNLKWCSWQPIPGNCYTNPWQCPGIKDPPGGLAFLQKLFKEFGKLTSIQFAQAQINVQQQKQQQPIINSTGINLKNTLAVNKADLINHIKALPADTIFVNHDPKIPGLTHVLQPGERPSIAQLQQLAKANDAFFQMIIF